MTTPTPESLPPPSMETFDPNVRQLLAEIKDLQTAFDYGVSPDIKTRRELVQDLDRRWPYHSQPITISGNVLMPVVGSLEKEPDDGSTAVVEQGRNFVRSRVVGMEFTSGGFDITQEPVAVDGEYVFTRNIICYFLNQSVTVYDAEENGRNANIPCFAPVSDAHIEDYPFETMASLTERLSYFFPQQKLELDAMLEENVDDEVGLLRALGGFVLKVGEQHDPNDFVLFEHYLNAQVDLDPIPYLIDTGEDRHAFEPKQGGAYASHILDVRTLYGALKGFNLIPSAQVKGEGKELAIDRRTLRFGARLDIIERIRDDDISDIVLPLDVVTKFSSVRSIMYGHGDTAKET